MTKGTTADQLNDLQQKYSKQIQKYEALYAKYCLLLDEVHRLNSVISERYAEALKEATETLRKTLEALPNDN
jgi:replication-associated recombination protein RarA